MIMNRLLEFCRNYHKTAIYGAGRFGREVCVYLEEQGIPVGRFLVTQPDPAVSKILGRMVERLETACISKEEGVILAVGRKHRGSMEKSLESCGIQDYFYVGEELLEDLEKETCYEHVFPTNQYVNVLLYHRIASSQRDPYHITVTPEHFEEQIRWLSKHYPILSFEEDWSGVSEPSIVISFDDGYADNYQNALPILKRYGAPAVFFISTGLLGTPEAFWWDRLFLVINKQPGIQLLKEHSRLKAMLPYDRQRELARLENSRERDEFVEKSSGALQGSDFDGLRSLKKEELQAMAGEPLVSIGAHTVSHPALPSLLPELQREEIMGSKAFLEELTGKRIVSFSYPYGDFDNRTVELVRQAGFMKSATVAGGLAGTGDPCRIPRNVVRDMELADFQKFTRRCFCVFAEWRKT